MDFISFRAYQGDAFIIRDNNTNILIDGGMPNTFGQIKSYIEEQPLDAVFVTHVDYDHLGGIFNLITDKDFEVNTCGFYMNHPEFPSEYQGEKVGFKHGHTLKDLLEKRGGTFKSITAEQKLKFGEIDVLVLSPEKETIKNLYLNWNKNITYENGRLKYKSKQTQSGDIINSSSSILLISCHNSKILMLGDSHAETAYKCISNLGFNAENKLSLSLLKLSHHGSKHNTSIDLLNIIDCNNFYISTNGGRYNHPDVETIQALENRANKLNTTFNVYLNYDIEEDIRHRCDFKITGLIFIEQCSLECS
ncbi:ComEC/Rec2 family competence protein [Enterovibrio norvegicus]|uniref:ComEC/Rec2 family competence protein n=1 Tax=Enterovibrio norvegicus TaxID=188144 RepID=UPI003550192A